MERKFFAILMLATMLISTICLPSANVSAATGATASTTTTKYVDPGIYNITAPTSVIALVEDKPVSEIASDLSGKFLTLRITPAMRGQRIVIGLVDPAKVAELTQISSISTLMLDRAIGYFDTDVNPFGEVKSVNTLASNITLMTPEKLKTITQNKKTLGGGGATEGLGGSNDKTFMDNGTWIVGAQDVWGIGFNGTGKKIAIVDTGVDYGALGFAYWNDECLARNATGFTEAFDADAGGMVYTDITLTAFSNASGTFIPTDGLDPFLYIFGPYYSDSYSGWTSSLFQGDMQVTGILNNGDTCHWGVMGQINNYLWLWPVLVIDENDDGTYDTVYVDMSWDNSFSDETALKANGMTLGVIDWDGDGIYDFSASSLGYFLDIWGASPNAADRGLVLQPIDPHGNYTCFEYDFGGHGTPCASSAAARNLTDITGTQLFGFYPGVAPGAQVMGITALFMSDVIEGELWAAGFDLIPGTEGWYSLPGYIFNYPPFGANYGYWNYTGNHKADVISNSWGGSPWPLYLSGLPWYSILTILEDCLSMPGYLDPAYNGTVICHAGGNGASGYGTITEPSYSTLAITVGASTSMNWTSDNFGFAGGYYDDIAPWSARGPVPSGNPKPDIVSIGQRAYAAGPLWSYLGDGTMTWELFGGTSQSTPTVAGGCAIIQEMFDAYYGPGVPPDAVKVTLKSTAKDLGYDPFIQGAGQMDLLSAYYTIYYDGPYAYSNDTWYNLKLGYPSIEYSWWFANQTFPFISYDEPNEMIDTSWYAGTVEPGGSSNGTIILFDYYGSEAYIEPVIYENMSAYHVEISGTTHALPTDWSAAPWYWTYGELIDLSDLGVQIPQEADLMTITVVYPYQSFDPDNDYSWEHRLGVHALDWNDMNRDTNINISEVYELNYGYNYGTTSQTTIGWPSDKFQYTPVIFLYQREQGASYQSIPYQIYINFYNRTTWDWIDIPSPVAVAPEAVIPINLTVPPDATQGVYEGFLMIDFEWDGGTTIALPVSVQVPATIPKNVLQYNITPATPTNRLYDPYSVEGYFDWAWRYEAGDWKQWLVYFNDSYSLGGSVIASFAICNWTGNMTDVDMFVFDDWGMIADGKGGDPSQWSTLWNQPLQWNTTTGATEEYVALWKVVNSSIWPPWPGLYKVILHNTLFNGTLFPEQLDGMIAQVLLDPSPASLTVPQGSTNAITMTLSTGMRLTNVTFSLWSAPAGFIVDLPGPIALIDELDSTQYTVRVTVPSGTQSGTYEVQYKISSDQMDPIVTLYVKVTYPPVGGSVLEPMTGITTAAIIELLPYLVLAIAISGLVVYAGARYARRLGA